LVEYPIVIVNVIAPYLQQWDR